jgi:hypothetical protein
VNPEEMTCCSVCLNAGANPIPVLKYARPEEQTCEHLRALPIWSLAASAPTRTCVT